MLRTLAFVGDRWTLVVLRQAFAGVRRFEQFQSTLGLSRAVLTDRLNRLVDAEILERKAYRDSQRTRHEYRLTTKGIDLYPVMMALRAWGDKYLAPDGELIHYRHRDCGGNAHVRLECDRCQEELSAREVEPTPGPGLAAFAED